MKFSINGNVIILHDWMYWDKDQLSEWCKFNQCQIQGQTIVVPNEKIISFFVLKWS